MSDTTTTVASYGIQVTTSEDGWTGNQLRFATEAEAVAYANNLYMRWTMVTDTRTVPTSDPVNYSFGPAGLVAL